MPDFELWADFDHNGRLTGSQSEYDARQVAPGLVLVANNDADSRAFPPAVTAGSPVRLDYTRYTPSGRDDEFATITVKFNNPAAAAGRSFFFRVTGINGVRTSFFDSTGTILTTRVNGEIKDHPFTTPTGPQADFTLQTRTFPGSPFGFGTTMALTYDPTSDRVDQSLFTVQLMSTDASGSDEIVHDAGLVTSAPVLFLENGVNAVRIYMCEKPDTLASFTDVRLAVRSIAGLSFVPVPADASGADTWLQDQFQPGIVVGSDTWRHAIIHMPRTRSDFAARSRGDNLGAFVTSHFPAHNVCLMNDFWERTISFTDADGHVRQVPFADANLMVNQMQSVFSVLKSMDDTAFTVDHRATSHRGLSWTDALSQLPSILDVLRQRIEMAQASPSFIERATHEADDAEARMHRALDMFSEDATRHSYSIPIGTDTVNVPEDTANEVFNRVRQMQAGANYGGNIESAPPSPGAPLGTIVLGNARIENSMDHMDPDVRRFFYKQRQPIYEIDTTWLDVGHVDEMLTFVPDRNGSQNFAALLASPTIAMALIQEAIYTYQQGLPLMHPNRTDPRMPTSIGNRLLDEGTSPLTRLMRGKIWTQTYPRTAPSAGVPDILEPPRIYQALARYYNGGFLGETSHGGLQIHGIDYLPGPGPDRFYPADISPVELLRIEQDELYNSSNAYIDATYLQPRAAEISDRFGGPRIFPMPVMFDRIANTELWASQRWDFSTSAYTPDVVNMQIVNGHMLVPRPYGPRMKPNDVTSVITAVLAEYDWGPALSRNLNPRFYTRNHLDVTNVWIERQNPTYADSGTTLVTVSNGIRNLTDVAQAFRDGFHGVPAAEIESRIRRSNPRNFTPTDELRDGWRNFTLNEGLVDIFEAYIQLIADSLGLTLHFVDSWFYHVHYGGIHCGTNVLREPARGQIPTWW